MTKTDSARLRRVINSQFQPNTSLEPEIGNLLSQVATAQKSGLSSIWFGQHIATGPLQMFQMLPLLARIIPEAKGMTIGSSVTLLAIQNPVQVAEEMATLDWLSDGNIVVGTGIGYLILIVKNNVKMSIKK